MSQLSHNTLYIDNKCVEQWCKFGENQEPGPVPHCPYWASREVSKK